MSLENVRPVSPAAGYIGGKRYSRVQIDLTGTHTNGIPAAALAVLGHAEQAKVSD